MCAFLFRVWIGGVTIVFIFAGGLSEYGYRRFEIYSSDGLLKGGSYIESSLVSHRGLIQPLP